MQNEPIDNDIINKLKEEIAQLKDIKKSELEAPIVPSKNSKGVTKPFSPAGIGTGLRYWKAKLKGKEFIDDYTYIEQKGNANNNTI